MRWQATKNNKKSFCGTGEQGAMVKQRRLVDIGGVLY